MTRQTLLDSTIALIASTGYAATTIQAVLDRSGISRGSLLHQFKTRDALMVAAGEEAVMQMFDAAQAKARQDAAAAKPQRTVDLGNGLQMLQERAYNTPTLGVIPHLPDIGVAAEDSVALDDPLLKRGQPTESTETNIAVIRLPRTSQVTS